MANMMHGSYKRWSRSLLGAIGAVALAGSLSCGGNGGSSSGPPTLADAWQEFEAGDYSDAVAAFHDLRDADPTLTDALNGLGWSFAFKGELDSAASYFAAAIAESSDLVDARAGSSAVQLALGDDDGAIAAATAALGDDPDWSFAHYAGVNSDDLHLILAVAYFAQGESSLASVQAQIDVLEPGNDLDPDDPESWNGEPSYAAALLGTIQALEERIGADMML